MRIKFDMANAQRNFAAAVNALGKMQGFDRAKIIKAEAGSILKKCMSETKVASLAKIEKGARLRAAKGLGLTGAASGAPVTINTGYKAGAPFGRVFLKKNITGSGYRRTHDADFVPASPPSPSRGSSMHFTDSNWQLISNAISDYRNILVRVLAQAKLSAGLAQQSWLLIAESLGINLLTVPGGSLSGSAIAQAAGARAKNGRLYRNGLGMEEGGQLGYYVTLINRLPYGARLGFQNILQAAIAGRVSYIQKSVAKGALDSWQKTARAFPGWKVTGGIN